MKSLYLLPIAAMLTSCATPSAFNSLFGGQTAEEVAAEQARVQMMRAENEAREREELAKTPVLAAFYADHDKIVLAACGKEEKEKLGKGQMSQDCIDKMSEALGARWDLEYGYADANYVKAQVRAYPEKYQSMADRERLIRQSHFDNARRISSEKAAAELAAAQREIAAKEEARRQRVGAALMMMGSRPKEPQETRCETRKTAYGTVETICK